jgi:hypothetical protein
VCFQAWDTIVVHHAYSPDVIGGFPVFSYPIRPTRDT